MLPTREAAERLGEGSGARPGGWKPTLWTFAHQGRRLWVKDVRSCSPLFRYTLGRLALAHEARIYRRLEGLPFVTRCRGKLDPDAIVLEELQATSLRALGPGAVGGAFFDDLERCVDDLHRRGVVHMDLRHRSNILVSADGRPRLVDFEIALYLGTNPLSRRLLAPLFCWVDRFAVLKHRVHYTPESVSPTQRRRHDRFRFLRRLWIFGRIWPPRWANRRRDRGA